MCDVQRLPLTAQSLLNSPKLRAGPHGAVGEGSFALPDLLGQETGQGWEIHPCGRGSEEERSGSCAPPSKSKANLKEPAGAKR